MLEDYSQYMTNPVAVEVPASVQEDENMDISPIEPNAYALTLARTYCHRQMVKIGLEVLASYGYRRGCLLTYEPAYRSTLWPTIQASPQLRGGLPLSKTLMSFGPGSQSQKLGQQLIQRLEKLPHIRRSWRFG